MKVKLIKVSEARKIAQEIIMAYGPDLTMEMPETLIRRQCGDLHAENIRMIKTQISVQSSRVYSLFGVK